MRELPHYSPPTPSIPGTTRQSRNQPTSDRCQQPQSQGPLEHRVDVAQVLEGAKEAAREGDDHRSRCDAPQFTHVTGTVLAISEAEDVAKNDRRNPQDCGHPEPSV